MIIGLDLDFTITAWPRWFSVITRALVQDGNEVHVLTHRERGTDRAVRKELAELGIEYTALHMPESDESAAVWKSRKAAELGLEMMIEDSPEVLAAMPEGVHRMWMCDPDVFDLDVCIRAMHGK